LQRAPFPNNGTEEGYRVQGVGIKEVKVASEKWQVERAVNGRMSEWVKEVGTGFKPA